MTLTGHCCRAGSISGDESNVSLLVDNDLLLTLASKISRLIEGVLGSDELYRAPVHMQGVPSFLFFRYHV